MMVPINSAVVLFAVVCLVIYKFIVYPALLSPLARIPNAHPTASVSPIWILSTRFRGKEVQSIHDAHAHLGPVVRLAPNEVSVNCVNGGIQTIYAGGFEKHRWYPDLFSNYSVPNMFSTAESKPHSVRKRMISHIYSKSFIQNSPTMAAVTKTLVYDRLLPRLEFHAKDSTPFNIYALLSAATMDLVTGYQFGLSACADFLRDESMCLRFLQLYNSRQSYNYWPQELPRVTKWLHRLGVRVVPRWVDEANAQIESWAETKMFNKAASLVDGKSRHEDPENYPVVYAQLQSALRKSTAKPDHDSPWAGHDESLIIASELLDHLAAGFDTSGITLVFAIHELSRRPSLQAALRKELLGLIPPIITTTSKEAEIPSAKSVDSLPLLHAILHETLRLHAAIPAPQPRISPTGGCVLGPNGEYSIPGGVRVSAQAWSLHRNADVYPDPEEWRPQRWQTGDVKEMNRWFWAFGSGGRMCVGSNLAWYQMKYILAAIYSNFTTEIVDDKGFEQMDRYTAGPGSGKLVVRLRRADDGRK